MRLVEAVMAQLGQLLKHMEAVVVAGALTEILQLLRVRSMQSLFLRV
jgi:hypothetical protein